MNHGLEVKAFDADSILKTIDEVAEYSRLRLEEAVVEARAKVAAIASIAGGSFLDAFAKAVMVRVADAEVPAGEFKLEGEARLFRVKDGYYEMATLLHDRNAAPAVIKQAGTVRIIVLVLPPEDTSK